MAKTIVKTRSAKNAVRSRTAKLKPKTRPIPIGKPKTAAKAMPRKRARASATPKPARQMSRRSARGTTVAPAARLEPRPVPASMPAYDELPIRESAPAGSAWGVFGEADQLGTINLLTPERVMQAANFIRSGRVFALNLPIDIPDPPLFTRGKHRHVIKKFNGYILDDYLDNFYPQASSQWDALSHVKHPRLGAYNGFPETEITGYGGSKLGIDNLARRGIAGRAVLADVGRYYEQQGKQLNYSVNDVVPFEDLLATLEAQKTNVWPGDILLVRIGWTKAYREMSAEQKAELARDTRTPGIEGSGRVARWLWEQHIAAVASDSPGLEAIPPPHVSDFTEANDLLHFHLLSFFGMPIGEMWNLEELAQDCANDNRYEFFLTSAPLNIPGGVGSPPNALAIK
jgi:kynurenine formamidase